MSDPDFYPDPASFENTEFDPVALKEMLDPDPQPCSPRVIKPANVPINWGMFSSLSSKVIFNLYLVRPVMQTYTVKNLRHNVCPRSFDPIYI